MQTDNNENAEISLKEVFIKVRQEWTYIYSKRNIIVIAMVIGGCIGLSYSLYKKTIYKATLSFALEEDQSAGNLNGALSLASQFGFNIGGGGGSAFSGDNLLELMKSRSLIEKALLTEVSISNTRKTLAEVYIEFNDLRDKWTNNERIKNIHFLPNENREDFSLQKDSLLGVFYKAIIKNNLVVEKMDKKLSLIVVKVSSKHELFSKLFTEKLVKEVSDFYIDTKIKRSMQNLLIIQHQTDSVRKELNNAISGVAYTSDAVPNPNPAQQILKVPSQKKSVDLQANQLILMELVKNLEIAKIAVRKETPLIQIIDTPILPLEEEKLNKLKGIFLGGLITGLITFFYILIRKIIQDIIR